MYLYKPVQTKPMKHKTISFVISCLPLYSVTLFNNWTAFFRFLLFAIVWSVRNQKFSLSLWLYSPPSQRAYRVSVVVGQPKVVAVESVIVIFDRLFFFRKVKFTLIKCIKSLKVLYSINWTILCDLNHIFKVNLIRKC